MVKSISKGSSLTNTAISQEGRLQNAEQLAKSLNSYLPNNEINRRKGFQKDKRICHLNAAYHYILHLEGNIKQLHNKLHSRVPEDCCLLGNTTENLSTNNITNNKIFENSDMTPTTPAQRNTLIHESSTISATASGSSSSSSIDKNNAKSSKVLTTFKNFGNIDASPILGHENHYLNDDFTDFGNKIRPRKIEISNKNSPANNTRKRKLIETDENGNNINMPDKENVFKTYVPKKSVYNTPKTSTMNAIDSNLQTPENSREPNLGQGSIGRNTYFLRSTTRLKNMLIANNPVIKTPTPKKSSNLPRKKQTNRALDSSIASTRSTSITTTPSVPNSNMSTNSSNEFENIDPKKFN